MPSLTGMFRLWSVYGLSSILGRSIAFLLLPLYTRVLSPEEYGIRAMVALGIELTMLLVAFGLKEATTRFYVGGPDGVLRPHAASTGMLTHAGLIGAGVAVGLVASPWLAGALLGDSTLAPYLRLGLIAGFFMHVHEGAFVYLRARGRARTVAMISLATLVASVALNLLFVVVLRWGVAGIFYSEILVFAVSGTIFTTRALREVGVRWERPLALAMMRFGAPLMVMPFAWLFVTRADVMFLTHYGSLAYVGIYALSVQCAQVLWLAVVYPFRNMWDPMQFRIGEDDAGRRMFRRTFQWVTFLAVVAAFGCALVAEDVIRVMAAPAFHGAAAVVPILVIAHVLEAVYVFFNTALLVRNRTTLVAAVAVITVAANLAANAVLVPHFLAGGAAAARVVAQAVMVLTTCVLAQRLWPQSPNLRALATVGAWAVALFAVARSLPELPLLVILPVKGVLVLALVALSIGTGALDRGELQGVWRMLRPRLSPRSRGTDPDHGLGACRENGARSVARSGAMARGGLEAPAPAEAVGGLGGRVSRPPRNEWRRRQR
jgi:O-antigen/teichoic acid export membrane protein